MKRNGTSIIEAVRDERDDCEDVMERELTEEEIARLDRQMEETYRTGATPVADSIAVDPIEEDLLEMFHNEVVRRLGNEVDPFDDDLFKHIERSFKRGRSEDQCLAEWRTRLS